MNKVIMYTYTTPYFFAPQEVEAALQEANVPFRLTEFDSIV